VCFGLVLKRCGHLFCCLDSIFATDEMPRRVSWLELQSIPVRAWWHRQTADGQRCKAPNAQAIDISLVLPSAAVPGNIPHARTVAVVGDVPITRV